MICGFVLKVNLIANRSVKEIYRVWHGRHINGARKHVRTDLQNESCRKNIEFCLEEVISGTSRNSGLCALRVH